MYMLRSYETQNVQENTNTRNVIKVLYLNSAFVIILDVEISSQDLIPLYLRIAPPKAQKITLSTYVYTSCDLNCRVTVIGSGPDT